MLCDASALAPHCACGSASWRLTHVTQTQSAACAQPVRGGYDSDVRFACLVVLDGRWGRGREHRRASAQSVEVGAPVEEVTSEARNPSRWHRRPGPGPRITGVARVSVTVHSLREYDDPVPLDSRTGDLALETSEWAPVSVCRIRIFHPQECIVARVAGDNGTETDGYHRITAMSALSPDLCRVEWPVTGFSRFAASSANASSSTR